VTEREPETDARVADRLLDGEVTLEDVPAGWEQVAAVLRAAGDRTPGPRPPQSVLDALAAATVDRPRVLARRRIGFGIGLATVVVLGGTSAAATSGSLPDPVQDVAHDIAAAIGVHVPESHEPGPPTTGGSQDGEGHGRSDEAPGRPDDPGPPAEPGQPDDPSRSDEAPGQPEEVGGADDAPGAVPVTVGEAPPDHPEPPVDTAPPEDVGIGPGEGGEIEDDERSL
jgi:hypothetical protein